VRVITAYEVPNANENGENKVAKRVWKRIFRAGKLTAEQAARDRKLRSLLLAEFPPLARPAIPRSLSASLKKAMKRSPKTSYQLAKEAGVSPIMLSRFLSGKRDIRLATADRLAHVLGMKLVATEQVAAK
jgi:transcriptional regulator with XRE-family HTH domain